MGGRFHEKPLCHGISLRGAQKPPNTVAPFAIEGEARGVTQFSLSFLPMLRTIFSHLLEISSSQERENTGLPFFAAHYGGVKAWQEAIL